MYFIHIILPPLSNNIIIFSFSITAFQDCDTHADCTPDIVKCVLPRIPQCVNKKCLCIQLNAPKFPWSARQT